MISAEEANRLSNHEMEISLLEYINNIIIGAARNGRTYAYLYIQDHPRFEDQLNDALVVLSLHGYTINDLYSGDGEYKIEWGD